MTISVSPLSVDPVGSWAQGETTMLITPLGSVAVIGRISTLHIITSTMVIPAAEIRVKERVPQTRQIYKTAIPAGAVASVGRVPHLSQITVLLAPAPAQAVVLGRAPSFATLLVAPTISAPVVPRAPTVIGQLGTAIASVAVVGQAGTAIDLVARAIVVCTATPPVTRAKTDIPCAVVVVSAPLPTERFTLAAPAGQIIVRQTAAWLNEIAQAGVVCTFHGATTGISEYTVAALDVAVVGETTYFVTATGLLSLGGTLTTASSIETGDIWFTPGTNCNVPRTELLLHSDGTVYLTATCDANPAFTTTYQVPERTGEWERARAVRMGRGARGNDWRLKVSTDGGDWRLQGMSALVEQVGRPR